MGKKLVVPKKDSEINRMVGPSAIKNTFKKLNNDYKDIINFKILLCPECGEWKEADVHFYHNDRYETRRFPICKQCLLKRVENRDATGKSHESVATIKPVLQFMDKPYIEKLYDDCVRNVVEGMGTRQKGSPFVGYITMLQSLPQYSSKRWKDSIYTEDDDKESDEDSGINENSNLIKKAKKRFGADFDINDLYYLETQYEDWVSRYECQTKSQEELFERLSFKKWEIMKATKAGDSTEKLDRTYQDLLNTANITPKQTGMDAFADAQTFGTLLLKWEETRPLPEIDPELQDVDKIGLYIDAFFRGHTSKMLGIKNKFSNIYEKVMAKYTVKPPEYEDDEASEATFAKIFGSSDDF